MVTQVEIAEHLGISERRVRDVLNNLDIDHKTESLDSIRLRYLEDLRGKAAGHISGEGFDLTKERVLTERIDRQLKELNLAERKQMLVNREQLYPALENAFVALKTSLMALAVQIKSTIDVQYGIDLDLEIVETEVNNALTTISRYDPSNSRDDSRSLPDPEATQEDSY